jgi:hypothetical protein
MVAAIRENRDSANFVIFADLNGNGVLDDDEPFAVTRADGSYSLNLDAGTYLIREQARDGWRQTYPQGGNGHIVTVGDGQIVSGLILAMHEFSRVSRVWSGRTSMKMVFVTTMNRDSPMSSSGPT